MMNQSLCHIADKAHSTNSRITYYDKADGYANDVINGTIPACKNVILACKRYKKDKKNKEFSFNIDRFEHFCNSVEKYFIHVKGKWAGSKIILQPWQLFIALNIFGFEIIDAEGNNIRRFRRVLLMVPRKNGKSLLASIICNYMLLLDGEQGAEIYIGATSKDQAQFVFEPAASMLRAALPNFSHLGNISINKEKISFNNSYIQCVIAKPGEGGNPHCCVHDEFHEHADMQQVNTMLTGMGARTEPLQVIISTAGSNTESPCKRMCDDAVNVLKGRVKNDRFFYLMYGMDEKDDHSKPETWKKANPNYNVSVSASFFEDAYTNSQNSLANLAEFKTKNLNVWVKGGHNLFNTDKIIHNNYEALGQNLEGKTAYIGIDLSESNDLTAIVALVDCGDGKMFAESRFLLPKVTVEKDYKYQQWVKDGFLIETFDTVINADDAINCVLEFASKYNVVRVTADSFKLGTLQSAASKHGIEISSVAQNAKVLTAPTAKLSALINDSEEPVFFHDANPILIWCFSNVCGHWDVNGNVLPRKDNKMSQNKIDGAMATIGAYCHMLNEDSENSLYKQTGSIFI